MSIHEPRPLPSHSAEKSAADGSPLRERVLSLRLPQHHHAPRAGVSGKAAWALVVLLVAAVAVLAYLLLKKKESPDASGPVVQEKASGDVPTASSGEIALDSKGYVMPVQRILVSPQVSGRIVQLNILEGRRVRSGEVLAEIEDVDYKDDLAHAESAVAATKQRLDEIKAMYPKELGQAKALLEQAKAEMAQLKADYERSKDLYFHRKAISQLDYELAQSKYLSADQKVASLDCALGLLESSRGNRIAAAEADMEQSRADRDKALLHLDWCKVLRRSAARSSRRTPNWAISSTPSP